MGVFAAQPVPYRGLRPARRRRRELIQAKPTATKRKKTTTMARKTQRPQNIQVSLLSQLSSLSKSLLLLQLLLLFMNCLAIKAEREMNTGAILTVLPSAVLFDRT